MYFEEDDDRDPFEVFGQTDISEEITPAELETAAMDAAVEEQHQQPAPQPTSSRVKTAFSWAGFAGGLAALVWIAGAIGGPLSYFGVNAVLAMDPAIQAGMLALAFGPAVLFWLGACAAGEALKARSLAVELTKLAQESRNPIEMGENQAQRLSMTVKTEIEALNDAVASALQRLAELEDVAQRNTALFDNAINATRENTQVMTSTLAQEREALLELNGELRGQTETMAHSIGRQIRLMREASKLVKTEVTAAEDALESHLASFAASATVMGERTAQFHQAADSAAHATASLNSTMGGMLDSLSEATRLTDSARQSAHEAVVAANETATAVRETTRSAVVEAKRAAQLIRAENVAMREAAAETLMKLQDAANAARMASEESQAAADRHTAQIEKRLSALASTAGAKKAAPAQQAPRPVEERSERIVVERQVEPMTEETATLHAAAAAAVTRSRPLVTRSEAQPRQARGFAGGFKGIGGWGNFLPSSPRGEDMPKPANEPEAADAFDLVAFEPKKDADAELKNEAIDLVIDAGVDLGDVLQPGDLERIAQSSRQGAAARRRAVLDAAPNAVGRIARHVKRHNDANVVANEFRARPDLAKSEKKSEGSELVRAYLLIDAALA